MTASVVTNAAPYAELNPTDVGDQIKLVHSGVALRNRGLDQVVAAVSGNRLVTLDLYLMPNDPEYLAELKNAAAQTTNVAVHEPVPYGDLVTTLNGFDVGVHVIPPVNFNYEWALPNKFFDSVQARQGMIVGPSPEMARTLRKYGLGAVTDGFSAQDIRAVVESLTVSRVREWKANANAAARALSSVPQIEVWDAAIRAIASRHGIERLPDE